MNDESASSLLKAISWIGLKSEYSSAESLLNSLLEADANLELLKFILPVPLNRYFHDYFFRKELVESPVSKYKALFTPERLRLALLKLKNPDTRLPVINADNSSQEIRISNKKVNLTD